MVRAAGTQAAIERLQGLIAPDVYKQQLQEVRAQCVTRASQLLIERELTDGDPTLDEPEHLKEKLQVLANIDAALVSLEWRISDIDEAMGSFDVGKSAAMNRQQRRKLQSLQKGAKVLTKKPNNLQDDNEDGAASTEDSTEVPDA